MCKTKDSRMDRIQLKTTQQTVTTSITMQTFVNHIQTDVWRFSSCHFLTVDSNDIPFARQIYRSNLPT